MAQVILFDVNETLLDTGALDPHFERIFGNAQARVEWFLTLEEIWLTSLVIGQYTDFSKLARAALQMVADRKDVELSAEDRSAVLDGMKALPPYPDVEEALRKLRDGGLRLAALTNGTLKAARAQMKHAGLGDFFEEVMSADEVQRLKPGREPYAMAAERLGVPLEEVRMVACHAWDIAGAAAAGCATGFVRRPGKTLNPQGTKPDLQGSDLVDLAGKILRKDRPAPRS